MNKLKISLNSPLMNNKSFLQLLSVKGHFINHAI